MAVPLTQVVGGYRRGARMFGWLLVPGIAAAVGFLFTLAVPRQALAPITPPPPAPTGITASGSALPATLLLTVQPGLLSLGGARIVGGVELSNGAAYHFPEDFRPSSTVPEAAPLLHPLLGSAQHISAQYMSHDGALSAGVDVIAADHSLALLYQSRVGASSGVIRRFSLSDALLSELDLAAPVRYLTLSSSGPVQGSIGIGDAGRSLLLPQGTPLLAWSDESQRGYVLGLVDETNGPASVTLAVSKSNGLAIGVAAPPALKGMQTSPRLYLERVDTPDLARAFAGFRHVLDGVAPAPPVPAGFRNQWGSWYVFGGSINENLIRNQIDAIAATYPDVGPWQIEIDAGWYLGGGHPDGQMGLVDSQKFPSGMRDLVDYAHERGVNVALYASAPWVDSRPSIPNWWVVQLGFVRDHLDWLIKIDEDEEGAAYVYDLSNPDLRAYLGSVVKRYLVDFDADGIELDMVGVIGPRGGPFRGEQIGQGQPVAPPGSAQTMEIYNLLWTIASSLKPDVWIETGYAAPALARSYANSWRLADDFPAFSHPYPFAGLKEQVTYAILQRQLLGRNAHLGAIYGGPETISIQRQWLAAAVALQAQTTLSVDLANSPPETTRMYREYLAALHPFSGSPDYGPGVPPEAFATTVDGTTYLALMNSSTQEKTIGVDFTAFGLAPGQAALAFDPHTRVARPSGRDVAAIVAPQTLRLIVLRQAPGVLWADRAWTAQLGSGLLTVTVRPGPMADGRLWMYAPGARAVNVDGVPSGRWSRDSAGFVVLDLPDGESHLVEVTLGS